MQLTLEQTATRLGKSRRQLIYMIQQGRLEAKKIGGRWYIDADKLALSDAQKHSYERKQRQYRAAVEDALDLDPENAPRRYSVRDLKAFQITLPLYRQAAAALGTEHPATHCLKQVLEQLTRGCHRFERSDKTEAYRAARDQASQAVCELVIVESAVADQLIHALEQNLMAALAGLMRRIDRRRRA